MVTRSTFALGILLVGCTSVQSLRPPTTNGSERPRTPSSRLELFSQDRWSVTEALQGSHKSQLNRAAAWIPYREDLLSLFTFKGMSYPQVVALLGGDPNLFVRPPTRVSYDMVPSPTCEELTLALTFDLDDEWRLVVTEEHLHGVPGCVP